MGWRPSTQVSPERGVKSTGHPTVGQMQKMASGGELEDIDGVEDMETELSPERKWRVHALSLGGLEMSYLISPFESVAW